MNQPDPQKVIQALGQRLANLEIELAATYAVIDGMMEERADNGQQDETEAGGTSGPRPVG